MGAQQPGKPQGMVRGTPTGRVFVRFAEGTDAAAQAKTLARAGFELESVPSYAPHAAWVRPTTGTFEDLLLLPGVEHAERQVIAEAARR
jgi:hypothetical protein